MNGLEAQRIHSGTRELVEEFNDFAYMVSHDISTPIRGMVEFARLLGEQGELLSDDGKLYLSLVVLNGERLQRISRGLLEYSRFNTRAKPFTLVDCNEIVSKCREQFIGTIASKKAEFDLQPLPPIMGDMDQIRQLFAILIENALTYQHPKNKPYISIYAEKLEAQWVFHFCDNGIGIAPKYYEQIFKPLQRLHTDEEYPGAGMGLTIARKIVARHGGQIWLESFPDRGTNFMFSIPAM